MSDTPGPVGHCTDHGHFTGAACPDCGGGRVLDGARRERLSRFLSGALRHFPGDAGIALDERGWTEWAGLVRAARRQYDWADERAVAAVVATDPKGRFERSGERVRAAYGHSVDVDLGDGDGDVPDSLYHGTDPATLDAIDEEGLRPMGRNEVHLSATPEAAREVGRRRAADPAVLAVDAAAMCADGLRVTKRGADTYTADRVPPEYLAVLDA
ncbi:MAG: RNA 2'-phosphotransferase [Halobacteriaceae archaeon]